PAAARAAAGAPGAGRAIPRPAERVAHDPDWRRLRGSRTARARSLLLPGRRGEVRATRPARAEPPVGEADALAGPLARGRARDRAPPFAGRPRRRQAAPLLLPERGPGRGGHRRPPGGDALGEEDRHRPAAAPREPRLRRLRAARRPRAAPALWRGRLGRGAR